MAPTRLNRMQFKLPSMQRTDQAEMRKYSFREEIINFGRNGPTVMIRIRLQGER